MPQKNTMPLVNALITLIVGLVIVGAVGLTVMGTHENWRFLQMQGQILDAVDLARSTASQQKNFALTPGADMWGDLNHMSVTTTATAPINPWQQPLKASILNSATIRLETVLPAVACRRTISSLVDNAAVKKGLVAAEAHADNITIWTQVYPKVSQRAQGINTIDFACGSSGMAHLALGFQIR